MRIVHFSDWHWAFTDDLEAEFLKEQLPEADLYICTGDMYANYPVVRQEEVSQPFQPPARYYAVDPGREPGFQRGAAASFVRMGGFKRFMGSPNAPIFLVRGNHDFINLAPIFEGCNIIHEFVNNELIDWNGIKVTGHQGIPYIYGGWNDEMQKPDLLDRVRAMPEADIFVTHYPPEGMLDSEGPRKFGLEGMGPQLLQKATRRGESLGREVHHGLHCFGHIHGSGGQVYDAQGFKFSNAAEAANVIDIDFGV